MTLYTQPSASKNGPQPMSTTEYFFVVLLKLLLVLALLNVGLIVNNALAAEPAPQTEQPSKLGYSVSGYSRDMNTSDRHTILQQSKSKVAKLAARSHSQPASLNTSSASQQQMSQPQSTVSYHHPYQSFVIYEGYSELYDDDDFDGYYRSFSVIFDADITSGSADQTATVYAVIFIRKRYGDWQQLYVTDDFLLVGDSSEDTYEVYTELDYGYSPNDYDILIELYDSYYGDFVASYGSDDSDYLYALPLESSDYDYIEDDYIEGDYGVHIHAGSSSLGLLLVGFAVLIARNNKVFRR
ncbi:choice-of-anchor H family protein [Thalassotalea ponticola]|uniref:choice-of-anchor H family protein n=1 Tax=Thalassotalea ponticola TaxID=1523392 RepID=UPI0025B54B7A|nr:choice-of-anchor H family protein [Thalassotalea ponticola]MDN3653088.1 choice-of-anchor H family protein [Thalassotalea ponticola]